MHISTKEFDLISIDIFDTLLFRAVAQPIDVFKRVWDKAREKNICLTDLSATEFMKLRIELERRARNKAFNREVTLKDIYREIPKFIVSDVALLTEMEVEAEMELCYPNFDMIEFVKHNKNAGKMIVLLSDMYLTAEQVTSILTHNNIDVSFFHAILISNEYQCSKQNGELYHELFKKFPQIAKDKILHIGDNKNSDYIQAEKAGVHAFHYDVIPDQLYSIYDYEKIRHNVPQKELLSLRKAASQCDYKEEKERTAYEIGASIMGPFLVMYISWVCDRLQKLGINRIYPLMREGYLLGELLKKEANYRGHKLEVKPIYISRKVTYIPSIEVINREVIEDMIGARNLTIREAIALVGLNETAFSDINEFFDVRFKETHKIRYQDMTLKEYIINCFLLPQNIPLIESYIQQQRNLLNQYLLQEMGDLNNAATIDIGFFGRIQQWAEKSLRLGGIEHSMKHFLATGLVGEKLCDGINYEGYYSTFSENSDLVATIHRTPDVLEKMISVTEGSTIGYRMTENKILPLKSAEVNNRAYLELVFEGIYNFQRYWFKFRTAKPEIADLCLRNRRETFMIVHRLLDLPRFAEADLLGNFEADTNFGTAYKKVIITEENKRLLEEKGIEFIDKCNVSYTYENSNIVWPKGLITLYDEFYYLRRALKNNNNNDIIRAMQEVVERVADQGITEIALYGAGENGRQFYFICSLYHIKVNCFIDRKESLWGTKKEGIEIIGLNEAIKKGYDKFIITSLFSISEIHDFIQENFQKIQKAAEIFHV